MKVAEYGLRGNVGQQQQETKAVNRENHYQSVASYLIGYTINKKTAVVLLQMAAPKLLPLYITYYSKV